jgi:hypothetical protein
MPGSGRLAGQSAFAFPGQVRAYQQVEHDHGGYVARSALPRRPAWPAALAADQHLAGGRVELDLTDNHPGRWLARGRRCSARSRASSSPKSNGLTR